MPDGDEYAAIWDVDGTLVDTAELHFRAWEATAAERGRPFSRDDFSRTFGRRNPEIIHILFGDAIAGRDAEELADRKEVLYRAAAAAGVELLPGVRALVDDLDGAGFGQAIGSSAPRANLDLILRLTGVRRFFDVIVSMEDVQRGKPDPQVFQVAAQRLGMSPARCVVLEDAVAGVEAAKAAGMKCIAVRFVGHHSVDSLRQAGADLVADSLEQVSAGAVRRLLA
ncbi:MAG TPA: HAD family phosphatase [Gemmataceae bacterium]|nr:HAD family phosphatase [Gemmataceae bacterium]